MATKRVDWPTAEKDSLTEAQLSAVLDYIRHAGPMTMTKREREVVELLEHAESADGE